MFPQPQRRAHRTNVRGCGATTSTDDARTAAQGDAPANATPRARGRQRAVPQRDTERAHTNFVGDGAPHNTRFVGIDLHKHFTVVAAVNAQQRIVLPPTRQIDLDEFPAWASSHFHPTDAVV